LSEYNSLLSSRALAKGEAPERYTDARFAKDVGMVERGKPYANTTAADWIAERNEPGMATGLAMEVVLEKPGVAVWIFFGVYPAEGVATPGAVRSKERKLLPDPRPPKKKAAKKTGTTGRSGGGRARR
jgi:hypothetical protein